MKNKRVSRSSAYRVVIKGAVYIPLRVNLRQCSWDWFFYLFRDFLDRKYKKYVWKYKRFFVISEYIKMFLLEVFVQYVTYIIISFRPLKLLWIQSSVSVLTFSAFKQYYTFLFRAWNSKLTLNVFIFLPFSTFMH